MEFVTIHDLSRELNVPARVIRYRLIQLIAEGKLKETDDFRRDDFKDDQHFVWKINPLSFMRETRFKPVTVANELDNELVTSGNNAGNEPLINIDKLGKSDAPSDDKLSTPVNQSGSQSLPAVTNDDIKSLEREMIDLLKDQLKTKDTQIHEQKELLHEMGDQLQAYSKLNGNLNAAVLEQGKKIENLLRLTGGKMDYQAPPERVQKV
jgi:hypothetical protein